MVRTESHLQDFPLVVAHRGASSERPENTLAAYEAAVAAGADAVELDVRLTADGVPVLLHDADVGVTSDGHGQVHRLPLADVKRLRVRGEEVPTFAEAVRLLSGRIGLDVEIKNLPGEESFDSPKEAAVEAVLRVLDEEAWSGPLLVCSFNWLSIERVRERAPEIATGFLTIAAIDPRAALVYAVREGHAFVLPHVEGLIPAGPSFVQEAHDQGVRVGTWTVDDEDRLAELYGWGVDAIASNDPSLAVRVRDRTVGPVSRS